MLNELKNDEAMALIGLIKWIALGDGMITSDEKIVIDHIVDDLGEENYHALFDAVDKKFNSIDEFKNFLINVGTPESRKIIYETMIELAEADAIDIQEADNITWLADAWNIE